MPARARRALALAAFTALAACAPGRATEPAPDAQPTATSPVLDDAAARYLHDPAARRAALERSLTSHENLYARQRLGAYGLETRGWDVLPVWNPRSQRLDTELADAIARGAPPRLDPGRAALWDGATPTTPRDWRELGERVFFEYPMRAEPLLEHALRDRAFADGVGLERSTTGEVVGVVVFRDVDGAERIGITCALCHTTVKSGELRVGAARRALDYGAMRLAWLESVGAEPSARERRRLSEWGPGRADVTEDDDEDPVAIPDLWALSDAAFLTQTGAIRHDDPLALAIRQETQLIDANHQRVRPPRELVWALTRFLYALEPPAPPPQPSEAMLGEPVFAAHCAGCHAGPSRGGPLQAAEQIGTDSALAMGRGRGTGLYRVPALVGLADGAPYLHDGSVRSLEELLSPARLAPDYTGGVRPGPVPGHTAGTNLEGWDRAALLLYLRGL